MEKRITTSRRMVGVFLLMLVCSVAMHAQKIHLIIFAATDDYSVGSGIQQTFNQVKEEFYIIEQECGLELVEHYFDGSKFTVQEFEEFMHQFYTTNKFMVSSEDILVFYYIGHGSESFMHNNNWPNLLLKTIKSADDIPESMELVTVSKNLTTDVYEKLLDLGAKFTLVIGDACNNQVNEIGTLNSAREPNISFNQKRNRTAPQYKKLFNNASGSMLVSSSSRGEEANISLSHGGLFSIFFINSLKDNSATTWENLLVEVDSKVQKATNKLKVVTQRPQFIYDVKYTSTTETEPNYEQRKWSFFAWVMSLIEPKESEKKWSSTLKSGNLNELKALLNTENSEYIDEMKRKTPSTYFAARAALFEQAANEEKRSHPSDQAQVMALQDSAYVNYKIALAFAANVNCVTKRDGNLMRKIKKRDLELASEKRSRGTVLLLGFKENENYADWVARKVHKFDNIYKNTSQKYGLDIKNLEEEVATIVAIIEREQAAINTLNTQIQIDRDAIAELEVQKKELDIERIHALEIELPPLKQLHESTMQEIERVLKEVAQGDISLDPENPVIMAGDAKVIFRLQRRRTSVEIEFEPNGQRLGSHCSAEISSATHDIIHILTYGVDDVPDKSVLKFTLFFRGNADWIPADNLYYTGEYDIAEEYIDKNGERHIFKIREGQRKKITNTELAFLRAYCAYLTTVDILKAKGIQQSQITTVNFEAYEYDKPADYIGIPGERGGPEFRGVVIDLTTENLYKHFEDAIRRLEQQIDVLENNIRINQGLIHTKTQIVEEKLAEKATKEEEIATLKTKQAAINRMQTDVVAVQIEEAIRYQQAINPDVGNCLFENHHGIDVINN